MTHGTMYAYRQKCRCELCRACNSRMNKRQHEYAKQRRSMLVSDQVIIDIDRAYAETDQEFYWSDVWRAG